MGLLIVAALPVYLLVSTQDGSLPVDQMTPLATIIGVATITGVETRENPDSRMIYTYYSLNFSEVWKGTPADPAVLQQAGGKLGDRVVAIAGRAFKFETGDTIVLFNTGKLYEHTGTSPYSGWSYIADGVDSMDASEAKANTVFYETADGYMGWEHSGSSYSLIWDDIVK